MPLAFRARLHPIGIEVQDNFNRPDAGSLGVTSDGTATWQTISGTWQIQSNKPFTATPASSNPIAAVQVPYADINLSATVSSGGGDAIYFRIIDASNWWRLRVRSNNYDIPYDCSYYQSATNWHNLCSPSSCPSRNFGWICTDSYSCNNNGTCPSCDACQAADGTDNYCFTPTNGGCANGGSCSYYVSATCHSTGTDYYVDLEKMVSGTLTRVATPIQSATTALGVFTQGKQIQCLVNGSVVGTYSDSALQSATMHGIGRGSGSSNNSQGLDDFVLLPAA